MDGDDIIRRKAELQSAGIIGDVILQSSPRAARLSDVFVRPSVRKKQLGLQVELTGATAGAVRWTARLPNEKGVEETRFSVQNTVQAGDSVVNIEPRLQHLAIEFSNGVLGVQIGAPSAPSQFVAEVFGATKFLLFRLF